LFPFLIEPWRSALRNSKTLKVFMRLKKCILILSVSACAFGLRAQETNQLEQLQRQVRQLQQMQENSDKALQEQRRLIESLSKEVSDLTKQQSADAEKKKLEQQLAGELQTNQPARPAPTQGHCSSD